VKLNKLKRYFFTGLLVVLPITIALWILYSIFIFASGFAPIIISNIEKYTNHNIDGHIMYAIFRVITIIIMLGFIVGIGFITTRTIGKKITKTFEYALKKVPIFNKIYDLFKQIITALIDLGKKNKFKGVAIIEYPYKGSYSIAFVTNDVQKNYCVGNGKFYNVFMPTIPNPTTGFFIVLPESEVTIIDLPVEHAFKLLISCGIIDVDELSKN